METRKSDAFVVSNSTMSPSVLKPDAIVRLTLYKTSEGGRTTAVGLVRYQPTLTFPEDRAAHFGHGCMFMFDRVGHELPPGETAPRVPVKFLDRESIGDKLKVGAKFFIWEGKDVGVGEVLEVFPATD